MPPRLRRRRRAGWPRARGPSASVRPRQSSSGWTPAMPIATSTWPDPPCAAERVRDDHARALRQAASGGRARRRPGRAAAGRPCRRPARSTDRRRRSRTRSRAGSRRSRRRRGRRRSPPTRRGSPAPAAGPACPAPSPPGRARPSTGRPPAPRPSTRPCARPRRSRREAIGGSSAARSSPGRTSGSPGTARSEVRWPRRSRRTGRRRAPVAHAFDRSSWWSAPRVRGATPRRSSSSIAQVREVVGRVHVVHQRPHALHPEPDPGPSTRPRCAARGCRARSSDANTSGGLQQQRVGAGAGAVRHDHAVEVLGARAREHSVDLERVEQRRVAGNEQHALERALERVAGSRSAWRPTGPSRSRSRRTSTRPPRRPTRRCESSVTTAIASRPFTLRSEPRTSENIACASASREPWPSRSDSRCLAAPKLFTGRIASVRMGLSATLVVHPAPGERKRSRKIQGLPGERRRRAAASSISVSVTSAGNALDGLVRDDAVDHVAVGLGDPAGRTARCPRCGRSRRSAPSPRRRPRTG